MGTFLPAVVLVVLGVGVASGEAEAIYPFEVRVGGQKAEYEGGVFAKVASPCAADATIEVPSASEMVIINVFPVSPDGSVAAEAAAKTKIILIREGIAARLSDTTDRSTLAPGLYGANVMTGQRTSRVMFTINQP